MQTDVLRILTSGGRILSGEERVLPIPSSTWRRYWILDTGFRFSLSDLNGFEWLRLLKG
jgi:hypothetical protein